MKIRTIRLHNVRRFQGRTAAIENIGDGITTICAPNESGKSTFFDALHAVFFHAHSGQRQEIRSLQPYSKGPVEIAVVIEDETGRRWRIEKRYLASKSARIVEDETGRIHAQADEAEAWIKSLLDSGMAGPAGLLWVRQGLTGFGPVGSGTREKGERDRLKDARQSLMSSVTGQIDNVTGGRKMDAIMRRCEADLEKIATRTGLPKAGGEWHRVLKRIDELSSQEERLSAQVSELSGALAESAQLRSRLETEDDPEENRHRQAEIEEAEVALEAAATHQVRIEAGERDVRLAALEVREPEDLLRSAEVQRKHRARLAQREKGAKSDLEAAQGDVESARATRDIAESVLTKIRNTQKSARKRMDAAIEAAEARRVSERRADIQRLLERGAAHDAALRRAQDKIRRNRATPDALSRAEALERTIATSEAAASASAASIRFEYDGAGRAEIDGQPIDGDTDLPVLEELRVDLPALGHLRIRPARIDADSANEARSNLAKLLDGAGAEDMASLRAASRDLQAAITAEASARDALEAIAPDGIETLKAELADLPDISRASGEEEDADMIRKILGGLERDEAVAGEAHAEARSTLDAVERRLAEASAAHRIAREALEGDETAPLDDEERARIQERLDLARAAHASSTRTLEALRASAPDIAAAEALRDRLVSARENRKARRARDKSRLDTLEGTIRARAEDDVEARLSTTRDEIDKARRRADRYRFEYETLEELRSELEAARRHARDAYFEPVRAELGPLLSMLHGNAEIEMDAETMLPSTLSRNGTAESLDVLSGGAHEQLAILTRLAFARLYARAGSPVPVILDDALVHSDDDRIANMFTALTRVARDQQIIVLSCRTRAFSELGGDQVEITTSSDGIFA